MPVIVPDVQPSMKGKLLQRLLVSCVHWRYYKPCCFSQVSDAPDSQFQLKLFVPDVEGHLSRHPESREKCQSHASCTA